MKADLTALRDRWEAAWPAALDVWSRYARLKAPLLCVTQNQAAQEGLTESFAMIRLTDLAVVVSLPAVAESGVEDYPLEVLAHEIGHHVLAPANLTDHTRLLARMRRGLPTVEAQAPLVANLYTDLLINDRLQRGSCLRMAEVYGRMAQGKPGGAVWRLYMRIYEHLWRLERGALAGETTDQMEGDALLGARLIRAYARDWLDGAGRFACLLLPYLLEDKESAELLARLHDTRCAAQGGEPDGLTDIEPGELDGIIHPAQDPALSGEADAPADEAAPRTKPPDISTPQPPSRGQARQPFEYGELLRAAGLQLTDHEAAVRYYREQARPHLVPFPSRRLPASHDLLPEGLEAWNLGDPLDEIDWLQSVIASPRIVPGLTTMRRVWGTSDGREPKPEPLDLDLYVDSSGSMANPQIQISYPALAGAIICLSALRAGARVQATLWSGTRQFLTTPGFVREEEAILRVLTGYFGGATAFPIHILRDTFSKRTKADRPAHILIISDDGVNTLFAQDERGNSGWDISAAALEKARGGGTMVLNLPANWETYDSKYTTAFTDIRRARDEQGWAVHPVTGWEQLVEFARAFSRRQYSRDGKEVRCTNAS
jgi:hypothetical protein